jgi:maltose alpha-D-glucosyltransferase/alpha-amylase
MQWSPDRNGGFSKADFERLFLPTIMDPVYGYPVVNVESQLRDPSSFLHWTQRMIEVRKQHAQVFGLGTFEVVHCENPSVLAFVRQYTDPETGVTDRVLCANNLSRFAQPAELHMGSFEGAVPHELLGRVSFPRIGELPYFITLQPHGFFWFQLCEEDES